MNMGLEKLVSYIRLEALAILDNHFQRTTIQKKLLHRKGFYHYSNADSFEKSNKTKLAPPRSIGRYSLRRKTLYHLQ